MVSSNVFPILKKITTEKIFTYHLPTPESNVKYVLYDVSQVKLGILHVTFILANPNYYLLKNH